MDMIAGWLMFVLLIVVNTVTYILIDGYFEQDLEGVRDEE